MGRPARLDHRQNRRAARPVVHPGKPLGLGRHGAALTLPDVAILRRRAVWLRLAGQPGHGLAVCPKYPTRSLTYTRNSLTYPTHSLKYHTHSLKYPTPSMPRWPALCLRPADKSTRLSEWPAKQPIIGIITINIFTITIMIIITIIARTMTINNTAKMQGYVMQCDGIEL